MCERKEYKKTPNASITIKKKRIASTQRKPRVHNTSIIAQSNNEKSAGLESARP